MLTESRGRSCAASASKVLSPSSKVASCRRSAHETLAARLLPPVVDARRSSAMVPSSMELYFLLAARLALPDELLDEPYTSQKSHLKSSPTALKLLADPYIASWLY